MSPDQLRAATSRLGLSGEALARAIGISGRQYRRYVAGEAPIPRTVELAVLGLEKERADG